MSTSHHRTVEPTQHPPNESERSRLPPDFLSTLQTLHPKLVISTNHYELDSHGHGESYHPTLPPDAVLYPSTVEEIRDILRLCCRERAAGEEEEEEEDVQSIVEIVSVIAYGAGTSLEGHLQFLFPSSPSSDTDDVQNDERGEVVQVPSSYFTNHKDDNKMDSFKKVRIVRRGGVSIDMSNFQSIGEIGPGDSFVKVGAGVTRNTLNEALRHTGMQFMVDPGADATIGGMTACAASGTAAVKYGTMRENVLAMTAVLPPTTILSTNDDNSNSSNNNNTNNEGGTIVHCGTTALKSSAGYNLPAILTGSEGTLGVITEVGVKLHPIPTHVIAASCAFDDLHSAAEAVAMICMMGVPVSRIELLDETSIRAFNSMIGSGEEEGDDTGDEGDGKDEFHLRPMEVKPTLFMEFAGHTETVATEDLSVAQSICIDEFEGTNFVSASDESTRQALWAARHRLYYSAIALRGSGSDEDDSATSLSTIVTDVCVPLPHFADIISDTARDVHELGYYSAIALRGSGSGNGGDEDDSATSQSTIVTDVCVPLPHFADIISDTARDVHKLGVVGPCFGHAGDGNFHCILPLTKNDTKEYKESVFKVIENLTDRAIKVGGTCTGEHGVGYGKKKYLKRMYGEGGVSMMEAVKRSLDPFNILNPGKI
eukprot:CAMPEP_0183744292 /NCGR_PEP_ID=MMETSP0737-20130205/65655_1 /TAXON_ID=385413 /ORGANISM="Thalassiosira miniscula, Strain CCMP1093" /LENGTH=653 /DNA_ID=CAMNT_0025979931 /DNA_START=214 /DNA_END=2172 /DNA_ORIENTATION=+